MNLAQVIAVLGTVVAVGLAGPKLYQVALRRARDDHSKRPALWNRFYSVDWGETTTNNYGYAPADGDHPQRFQHAMYLQLLDRLREERGLRPGLKLLEVSCGRGGGLNALRSAAGEIDATGLDVAESAVAFCRRTYGENEALRFVQGSALDLPFPDATFDVVLNVEASNDYGDRPRFFREAARVLKPDGLLLYADTMKQGRRDGDGAGARVRRIPGRVPRHYRQCHRGVPPRQPAPARGHPPSRAASRAGCCSSGSWRIMPRSRAARSSPPSRKGAEPI